MATGSYVSVNGGIVTANGGSSMCPAGRGRRVSNFLFQISNLPVNSYAHAPCAHRQPT